MTNKKLPKVSIIIPLYVTGKRFFKDLKKFSKLKYPNYEIIVVSDSKVKIAKPKVKFLLTGKSRTGPAEKRDDAIKIAKGSICAFIDDDAYPDPSWLDNALVHFQHPQIAAVGGPGVTPREDTFWEQLTGLVYESIFCGGGARHRFVPEFPRFVLDYPAYNLIVRKDVLNSVGGYGSHFYGGEDTFLCLKIIKKGWRILYDPKVLVYHHRRELFKPYLAQIANIGKHRGYFAKKFPETSRGFWYFMPSVLTTGFVGLTLGSIFNADIRLFFSVSFSAFYLLAYTSVVKKGGIAKSFLVSLGIIFTHLVYGVNFVRGILTKELIR